METPVYMLLAVVGIAALAVYMAFRSSHVAKLGRIARAATPLPPTKVLSWSAPTEGQLITSPAEAHREPESIDMPQLKAPEPVTGAEAGRPLDRQAGLFTASLDAVIASLPSLHDLSAIDWSIADGIRLSAASGLDLSRWSNLREYVAFLYFDFGEPKGSLNRLVGYVGEAKAGDHFESQGAEVLFNEAPNVPGYDLTVDGDPIQVKVGGTAHTFAKHFDRYQDIPVVTGADNIGLVPEGADVSFLDSLDADQVRAATKGSLNIINDDFNVGGPVVPYVTVIRSGLEQIGLLVEGHTDLTSAAKNVGLDAAGVGLGGWAGVAVGAATGSFFGPVGTVVGGFLGALAGAVGGRAISNEFRYADFKASAEAYQKAIGDAQQSIQSRQIEAHGLLVAELTKQQGELRGYLEALQRNLGMRLSSCHHWQERRCVAFVKVFPKVLARLEVMLRRSEEAELAAIKRSSLARRLLWPRLEDLKYRHVRDSFRQRMRVLASAKAEFEAVATKTPGKIAASEAIRRIETFARGNPFDSPDFDNVCRQLRQVTETAREHERRLKEQVDGLARREYVKRLAAVRKRFQEVAQEVSESLSKQAATVASAKDRLLREARKVGIDLEARPEA